MCRAYGAVGRMLEAVVENGLFDLGSNPVGMWSRAAGQLIEQTDAAIGPVVAADLVKLLPAVAHHLAGFADVAIGYGPALTD